MTTDKTPAATILESLDAAGRHQDWAGMDGAVAWHLIDRHAEGWAEIGEMMQAWLEANRVPSSDAQPCTTTPVASQIGANVSDKAPDAQPVAWTLRETLDAGRTTTSACLWFSDPKNSAWVPLYAGAAPVAQQAAPVTARDVARQVFALCESFEDQSDSPADSLALERFTAGTRFAAKRIRTGIGTWLTDEEKAAELEALEAAAHPQQPAATIRDTAKEAPKR